jgi:hypothetical protein
MFTEYLYSHPLLVYLIWLAGHIIACRFMVLSDQDYKSQKIIELGADHRTGCEDFWDFLRVSICDSLAMAALITLGALFCEEYAFCVLAGAIFVPYGANVVEHFDNVAFYRVMAKRPEPESGPHLFLSRSDCYAICAKKCVGYAVFVLFLFGITSNPLLLGGGLGMLCWGGLQSLECVD